MPVMKQTPQADWVLGSSFNENDTTTRNEANPLSSITSTTPTPTPSSPPATPSPQKPKQHPHTTTTPKPSLYFHIGALYRISRFPFINSPIKRQAFEAQKYAYLFATSHWIDPIVEETIPHTFATGDDGKNIPLYVRVPVTASSKNPTPTILLITGLDGYRPDNTQRTQEFLARGWATVIAEIPATADCPGDVKVPKTPDRLWDSVFKWMGEKGVFDMKNVVAWGLSCGWYYAVRIAHTHAKKLRGAVGQGG
ncbi:MAG: hypothetical protein Q9166_003029 [cf. Caloplaca sp. 2 TL-2023]